MWSHHRFIPPPPPEGLGAVTRVLSGCVRVQGSPLLRGQETVKPHGHTKHKLSQMRCHLAPVALVFSFLGCGTRTWGAGIFDFSSFRCLYK